MSLFLFGPPRNEVDGREVIVRRRKAKALLIYLAVTKSRHQREALAALLWPESDHKSAHGSLRRHLSELNGDLGGGWVDADRETVGLTDPASLWLDTDRFSSCIESHTHDRACSTCIPALTEAAELHRADFLAGFNLPGCPAFDEWQFFHADGFRRMLAGALDRLVSAHLETGDAEAAIPHARRRLGIDPHHEPAHRQLIRLYIETGDRPAALRQYERCVTTLEDELGVAPDDETEALHEHIHRRDTHTANAPHGLPAQTTPFIGRESELVELARLFDEPAMRLLTILAPGGMGKTRLALEAAAQQIGRHRHGVYFVSFSPIRAVEHIAAAIADAIGFQFQAGDRRPELQLLDYLRQKQMLLVLDNFEHLLDGAPLVQDLLEACPSLRIWVTSRERLRLTGETVFALGSLDFPTWETPEEAAEYSALRLFVQAARRTRPEFEPGADDLQYIARICRLVGGMPLGIILAGSWAQVLSPADIAAELTQGFDFLEAELHDLPDRQRNMRTVLAYSWQRLTGPERDGFMRLSVFRGGFTREAARTIAGVSLRLLAHLVDKSLVQPVAGERYDIHELLRQYGETQLRDASREDATRDLHSAFYLDFVHSRESVLAGECQTAAVAELTAEFENILAAWWRGVESHNREGIDRALGGVFRWFWLARSRQHEGQALLRHALQAWAPESGQQPHPVWMRISARIMEQSGPGLVPDSGRVARVERALDYSRQQKNRAEEAFCLWALGLSVGESGVPSPSEKTALLEQSLQYGREFDDRFFLAQVLESLGHHRRRILLQVEDAIPQLEESLEIRRDLGDRFGMARSLRELGFAAWVSGLDRETEDAWQEGYAIRRELGDQQGLADSLFFLSVLHLNRGDWQSGRAMAERVAAIAPNIDESTYQGWASRALEIASIMEQTARDFSDGSCSFPNVVNAFTARLFFLIFNIRRNSVEGVALTRILDLAETENEIAVCLPYAALQMEHEGDREAAVEHLALAFRYAHIAEGWIGHLPEIVDLRQRLRDNVSPGAFRSAWERGRSLEIRMTVEGLRNTRIQPPG